VVSHHTLQLLFWTGLALVILAPLVAIWRNVSAMALIYAEISTRDNPPAKRFRPLIEAVLKTGFALAIGLWLLAILPLNTETLWLLALGLVVAVAAVLVFRRQLIYWHSEMEVEIRSVMETGENRLSAATGPWLHPPGDWNLRMVDCTLPDLADVQGKPIADLDLRARFGCSVVGIERQGYLITLPPPDAVLYPRDKVLLMGTREQVQAGKDFLGAVSGRAGLDSGFEEIRMEAVTLPTWSRAADKTLAELAPAKTHGVQIAGVNRSGLRILNPNSHERLRSHDEILVLGTPVQIAEFKSWIQDQPGESLG
jgi:CPA2 family monovalent cation:H+ antiporter-2